jgi:cell division septal protein FtsQ
MARKKKPSKRRVTRLKPTPFVVILLIVNLVAGLIASRVTVIRRVQVSGAQDWDKPRLESIMEQLKGKPCALINRYAVESMVQSDSAIKSARFDRSLFGSAVLTVTYQIPVARFYNHLSIGLSDDGVVFKSAHLPEDIPLLEVSGGPSKTYVTIANDFPTLAVAHLAEQVKQLFPKQIIPGQTPRIEYGTGSSLCLNIGTSQVILGSCDGLDGKLAKLQEKLTAEPDFLARVKSYNLLDPQNPMTVPR